MLTILIKIHHRLINKIYIIEFSYTRTNDHLLHKLYSSIYLI